MSTFNETMTQNFSLPSKVRELTKIESINFIRKLVILAVLLTLGTILVVKGSFYAVIGILILGAMYAHGVELQHQCIHFNSFNTKWLNHFFGYLVGLPMLVSFCHYKAKHMRHHAKVGTKDDSEFFDYKTQQSSALMNILWQLLSMARFVQIFKNIIRAISWKDFDDTRTKKENLWIKLEYISFVVVIGTIVAITALTGNFLGIFLWLIPVLLVAEPLHYIIELPEHFLCNSKQRSVFENSRTIKGSKFSFWFTNGNNYHVEHHFRPNVSIDYLPELHEHIKDRIHNYHDNYFDFFAEVLKRRHS